MRIPRSGALYALGAYGLWGLLPIYWQLLRGIPLAEVLAHRVLWSLATIVVILAGTSRMASFRALWSDRKSRYGLLLSGLFIGANWSMYIFAVYRGQLVQASLGYYINPLLSVAMGVWLLGERLNRIQIIAVAVALTGVLVLAWQHRGLPWIALCLAVSFAGYGFAKKRLAVDPLAGLGLETFWLAPLALGYLLWMASTNQPQALAQGWRPALLLAGTGPITLAPLFLFNGAARRLPLSALGFYQYLSPTLGLIVAVALFHEPFTRTHAAAFGLIWVALALYTWNGLRSQE